MKATLEKVYQKEDLTEQEMTEIARAIFIGQVSEIQIASFLTALKMKGETVEEMTALAKVLQEFAPRVADGNLAVMDNCGTGGDQSGSFNISTTSAFVLAAGGVPVAKHGNRSVSSKSGSSDVLTALQINSSDAPEVITRQLQKNGIAFLFAPNIHPHMKYVTAVRKKLATPTIFNLIGPLTNPVPLKAQLMGIYRADLIEQTAQVLGKLGRSRAVVINGAGLLDEATLAGENYFALLAEGKVTTHTLTPEQVGLKRYPLDAVKGGDAKCNARILIDVLDGQKGAYLDTVLLNAGLGFYAYGKTKTPRAGVELAREIIVSGRAKRKLKQTMEEKVGK